MEDRDKLIGEVAEKLAYYDKAINSDNLSIDVREYIDLLERSKQALDERVSREEGSSYTIEQLALLEICPLSMEATTQYEISAVKRLKLFGEQVWAIKSLNKD